MKRIIFIMLAAIFACGSGYAQKTYKVGDYYTFEDGDKGIVFEVTEDGQHGKVVALRSIGVSGWVHKGYKDVIVGATSRTDGAYNMLMMREQDSEELAWYTKFGAAGAIWILNGEGWYLPSIEELKKIILDVSVHSAINWALAREERPGIPIGTYWSSTEVEGSPRWAWAVIKQDDILYENRAGEYYVKGEVLKLMKTYIHKVLPVRAF